MKAYYKNTKPGNSSQGDITYRFMLGKNITNDFNVERNHHYKLILSFIGDANNVDWHIDYTPEEEEREEGFYFRIPYNLDDDAEDFAYIDEPNDEHWYTNENWKQSYVWYAYDQECNPIAEIVKELVYYDYYGYTGRDPRNDKELKDMYGDNLKLRKFYQVVTIYPIDEDGDTDLRNGLIAQVLACDSETSEKEYKTKVDGAKIAMVYRFEKNTTIVDKNYQYRGDCVILSNELTPEIADGSDIQNSHNPYRYIKYDPDTKKLSLIDTPLKTKLETRPWREIDNIVDNNQYPIVKIGGSYWFKENLRATHYSYPEQQPLEAYHTDGITEKHDADCVYMYHNERMYKANSDYGFLYNLAALCGASDNDPYIQDMTLPSYCICQRESDDLWTENDWQITPSGWHIPTCERGWEPGVFYEYHVDNQYLMDYVSDNLARCIVDKGNYKWPDFPDVTIPNLSGLSLLAIPADGVSSVSFELDEQKIANGDLTGVCIPFWADLLISMKEQNSNYIYANEPFMCLSDEKYYVKKTLITSLVKNNNWEKFYKEISKQYLPIRPCRHSSSKSYHAQQWSNIESRWIPQQ